MKDYKALKRYRSILNFLILDSAVIEGVNEFPTQNTSCSA